MKKLFGIVGLCAVLGTAVGAESDSAELLYQRALHLETAKADYDGAIPIYATILSQHAQNTALAAKALFRQGVCYEKTGKLDLARQCARKLLGEFKTAAASDADMVQWAVRLSGSREGQLSPRDLSGIQLPDHPSKEQVRAYITAIVESSRGRRSWGSGDPQVRMLGKVGPQHVDLLIATQDIEEGPFYLRYAIVEVADESSKKVVLENLETYPTLAEVVLKRGWEQDARETLLRGLRNDRYLPTEWIQAVSKLNDPASYPLLRAFFIHGINRAHTYNAIKNLPITDLPGAVREAWTGTGESFEKAAVARIAVDYGQLDALEWLFERLCTLDVDEDRWELKEIRAAISRSTKVTGTKEEMAQWWKENRGALRFDPDTRKFVVSQTGAPAPSKTEAAGSSAAAAAPESLDKLELPEQPSKAQVRQYIEKVLSGSESLTRFSSNDPRVRKLRRVGSGNVDLLIDFLDSDHESHFFLISAIKALANDSNKKSILDGLAINPELVEVVVQRGWEQDAKQTLVKELEDAGEYLPTEWIVAVARLRDPATYPLLRNYFVRGSNKHSTYEAIKYLPIEDLAGAVKDAWQASREFDTTESYMALIAAQYGHLDALEFLAQQWADLPENDEWFANQVRRVFAKITDFTGTGTDAPAWFKTHRDRLKFDPATKKFVTGKSDAPPANSGEVK